MFRQRSLNDASRRRIHLEANLVIRDNYDPSHPVIQTASDTVDHDTEILSFGTSSMFDEVGDDWNNYRKQVDRYLSATQKVARAGDRMSFHIKPIISKREFPRAPHGCSHSVNRFSPSDARDYALEDSHLASQTAYLTWSDCDGLSMLAQCCDWGSGSGSLLNFVSGLSTVSSVSQLPAIDWVTLYDRYVNACQAFIPAAFMIGEDIIENDIFLDAFKVVLNPSRAIGNLIKYAPKFLKHISKHTTLGDIYHQVAKHSSDSILAGAFGVRPAINDIKDAVKAHKAVTERMQYLREHVGEFVPVRVRSVSDATIVDSAKLPPYTWITPFSRVSSMRRVGTMGCWARVRRDMNFTNLWSAYLQYFGVDRILGLAWELIPFSFVVDWFLNTKHVINYFTRLNSGGPFSEFRAFTCSSKTETISKVMLTPGALSVSPTMVLVNPSAPFDVGSLTTSNYQRSLILPGDLSPVSFAGFNSFQVVTGASLFLQRVL